jgi:hypothetical protein
MFMVASAGKKAAGGGQQDEGAKGKQDDSHGINPITTAAACHGVFAPVATSCPVPVPLPVVF